MNNNRISRKTSELCWGRQPVLTLLESDPSRCQKILLSESGGKGFSEKIEALASKYNIILERVNTKILEKLSEGENHQGIIVKMSSLEPLDLKDLLVSLDPEQACMLIVLDHIQDPHNLGAIIRSAEASGSSGVIFPSRRASTANATVIKTSAGSALRTPLVGVVNVSRTLMELQKNNFWVVGLDHRAKETLWTEDMPSRLALVVGSEGQGISRLVLTKCDETRRIPMAGQTASLNASVAAALGMFEWTRTFLK